MFNFITLFPVDQCQDQVPLIPINPKQIRVALLGVRVSSDLAKRFMMS